MGNELNQRFPKESTTTVQLLMNNGTGLVVIHDVAGFIFILFLHFHRPAGLFICTRRTRCPTHSSFFAIHKPRAKLFAYNFALLIK